METGKKVRVEREIGGRLLSMESGRYAKQANGAVWTRYGDTVVLTAATEGPARKGIDFFPLTVDYRERRYATGRFPGGFYKREGRPTDKEILTMRLIDRPVRPLFPKGYQEEVQVQALAMSADEDNDPDLLAMNGASAALSISGMPFQGPIAAVRVGRVEDKFVINPTYSQVEYSDFELLIAGHKDAVIMIEMQGHEVPEAIAAEAIAFGQEAVVEICGMIAELASQCCKPPTWSAPPEDNSLFEKIESQFATEMHKRRQIPGKQDRSAAVEELYDQAIEQFAAAAEGTEPEYEAGQVKAACHQLEEKVVRQLIREGKRADGRAADEVRPVECEVGLLPRTHGSAVFIRGETQALVVTTLGTISDEQVVDGIQEEYSKKFMLHYNFPPYSVGETKMIRGPSRRDIGHGALAEKSLEAILPDPEDFPYTVRLVSEITDSNGSSSMASVCGGTLALMDAGVPIKDPVAGISIGMLASEDGGDDLLLTDIIGEEDHFADMDFKVAGTQNGITGIQMDLKAGGIRQETIVRTLEAARVARGTILKEMLTAMPAPRSKISDYAPRLITVKIPPDKIGKLIGPGGKGIKKIQQDTGAKIDIEDDGTVYISTVDGAGAEQARALVEAVTAEVKVGSRYQGKVVSIKDFGVFVEIAPGTDGLCHISELADHYVDNVSDVATLGQQLEVEVIAVDDQGRLKLSHRAVMDQGPDKG